MTERMPYNQLQLDLEDKPVAVIIQQGKILDFIDGKTQRDETPEEYVRQEIAKSLVREYGYPKKDVAVEFTLRVGSRKPRADLVIFTANTAHTQETSYIIVECKAQSVKSSVRYEFGSSVPEIAAEDISPVLIPRLDETIEKDIADMVEKAAKARAEADELENVIAATAEAILDRFLAGDRRDVTEKH